MSSSRLLTAAWRREQQSRLYRYVGDDATLSNAGVLGEAVDDCDEFVVAVAMTPGDRLDGRDMLEQRAGTILLTGRVASRARRGLYDRDCSHPHIIAQAPIGSPRRSGTAVCFLRLPAA